MPARGLKNLGWTLPSRFCYQQVGAIYSNVFLSSTVTKSMSTHDHCQHPPLGSSNELVLVVHGVGDPQPGETLSLFARSVAESRHPLTEHQETLWLEDQADSVRDVETFATHVRHLDFQGNRSTLAEVYWADLSRVNRGLFGVLSGLIQILFGLRYVAFVASQQAGSAAKGLQWLGLICSRLLHGPVLAVNFVLALLMLTVVGTEVIWPGSSEVSRWASFLVLGTVSTCLLMSYLGWRLTKNSVCHRFWYWVMITSLFVNALMIYSVCAGIHLPLVGYCAVMVTMLGAQWITLVIALLIMTGFWIAAVSRPKANRRSLNVALLLPAVTVGIWGLAIPLMWVTGSNSIIKALPRGTGGNAQTAQAAEAAVTGVNADQVRERRARRNQVRQTVKAQFHSLFEKAAPLIGVQCIMFLFIATISIIQLARYMRWSERSGIADYQAGSRAPRLIVSGFIQGSTIVCAIIGMILVLYVSMHEYTGDGIADDRFSSLLVEANKYAIGFLLPIGGLLLLSLHLMRPAFDIILDVTNHFYFRSATAADRIRGFSEDFDIDEVTFDGGDLYYSRRDVIHRRIKRILEYYRETLSGEPVLTIVSHSQGSMIAIEVLNDDELSWVSRKFKQVNFITMGSPFHHIYQQYFQHFYPPLDDDQWKNLRSRVSRWLNIYRIDDYVGTEIEFPAALPQVQQGNYTNHPVERKGHMRYWCDRQVLSIIRRHDICRSLSSHSRISRTSDAA